MPLTRNERQEIVENLTTNCDCWKGDGDDAILNSLPDEKLGEINDHFELTDQAVSIANAAANGTVIGEYAYRVDPKSGEWQRKLVKNAKVDDEEELEEEMEAPRKKGKKMPFNRVDEEDEEDEETPAVSNIRRPRTLDEWFRMAPPDVQNTFQFAKQVEQREKDKLIAELLNNVADEGERNVRREYLQGRSIEDLENLRAFVPKPSTDVTHHRKVANRVRPPEEDDGLDLPVMNWESLDGLTTKVDPPAAAGNGSRSRSGGRNDGIEMAEDEWFQQAPAYIRNRYQNAVALEATEKRKIIDDIVGNAAIVDDDQERRLVGRLTNKSLEELRDLAAIYPKREAPPPQRNYFGQSVAIANRSAFDPNEDVLPLPTMDWANDPDSVTNRKRKAT